MHISRSRLGMEGRRSEHMQESSSTREQVQLISEGELCLDLINSEHFDYRGREEPQDLLEQIEWVQAFSQHWHLSITSLPDTFTFALLRALRTLLRQMLEAVASNEPILDA